jgi:hypothetical protein
MHFLGMNHLLKDIEEDVFEFVDSWVKVSKQTLKLLQKEGKTVDEQ